MARTRGAAWLLSTIFSVVAFSDQAHSDCNLSDDVITCSGTVQGQLFRNRGTSLFVEKLDADIADLMVIRSKGADADSSSNGDPGQDAANVVLSFDGKPYGVTSTSQSGRFFLDGVAAVSEGGKAASGDHDTTIGTTARADPGGVGGAGLNVSSLFESGTVSLRAGFNFNEVIMLGARSQGGAGGAGGEAKVDTVGSAFGGYGNSGGAGSDASAFMASGTLSFNGTSILAANGILASSFGGVGGDGGEAKVDTGGNTHGGAGGEGGSGGQASATIESGSITLGYTGSAVNVESVGASGGKGGEAKSEVAGVSRAGDGGAGGASDAGAADGNVEAALVLGGGDISITARGGATAIRVHSKGGDGGAGGDAFTGGAGNSHGGDGGDGGAGGNAKLTLAPATITVLDSAGAVFVQSFGGKGADGGSAQTDVAGSEANGGDAGRGGRSGSITVTSTNGPATIRTTSMDDTQHAVVLQSIAGDGGNGGDAKADVFGDASGGNGGPGGTGGTIDAHLWADITTSGAQSQAVFARSYGGSGGNGGSANALAGSGSGGAGAGSGPAGDVAVAFQGSIETSGEEANAILAQSVGGFSGSGGSGTGFNAFGAGSQSAGDGGTVDVTVGSGAKITTTDEHSYAVQAQSVGGGGGRGGSGKGLIGLGSSGSAGGDGQDVTVTIHEGAVITTSGRQGRGVQAMSVGGGGGDGGGSGGILSLGGQGGSGGAGASVTLTNDGTVNTSGDVASGLFASSIGGGGGSANSSSGVFSFGASGGKGGTGGVVTIDNSNAVSTKGSDADAVFAQSVGGGGGKGASSTGVAPGLSIAMGGKGGAGDFSNTVTYNDTGLAGRLISTQGDRSRGAFLQSVGGGGGDGGNAISVTGGTPVSVSLGLSGAGGAGSHGGIAQYQSGKADVATAGSHAAALQVQSVGGGGGNAGTVVSATATAGVSLSFALGASGGGGGDGRTASIDSTGALSTLGIHSPAVLAQSIGGGGGNAGTSASGSIAAAASMGVTIGGAGGTGGDGANAQASGGGGILTKGDSSAGVHLQSIGGGGGNGGATVAANGISGASADVSVGGAGGAGGTGGIVTLNWSDGISTTGRHAGGVIAQSIGGGGGHSGTTVAGSVSSMYSLQAAVGGKGGDGGRANNVAVALTGKVATAGDIASGVLAQSIGGGGGHSGATVAGTAISQMTADLSIGGAGGAGGDGMGVKADVASVSTKGHSSTAVSAMSVGGGGGSSHFTGAFSGESSGSLNTSIGGKGGSAGDGGAVSVSVTGALDTAGHNAAGVKALSIGGGGGDSGMTVAGSLMSSVPIGVSVGGDGGGAGSGETVAVATLAGSSIITKGDISEGILAASIARSGGSAGHVIAGSALSGGTAGVAVGGKGGTGGEAGAVDVASLSAITTSGTFSSGIEARSVAGGGGSAKGSIAASALSMGDSSLTLGGGGGGGGTAGTVTVASHGTISTGDVHAYGILTQSLGGAGGNGGFAAEGSFTGGKVSGEAGVAVGGSGGKGGTAGAVLVTTSGSVVTGDIGAIGVLAQSIGGSGGAGGNVYSGNLSLSTKGSATVNVDVGGKGGDGATASSTTVNNAAAITTDGFLADGIVAQSVGGNGGSGGSVYSVVASVAEGSSAKIGVDVGGSGGSGEVGGKVTVSNIGAIKTRKGGSSAVVAMSIGGGGGKGGAAANLNLDPSTSLASGDGGGTSVTATVDVGVGGDGGSGGDGGKVELKNSGLLTTAGASSKGLYAMSVGGGGGDGGTASSTSFSFAGVCSAFTGGAGYGCKPQGGGDDDTTEVSLSLSAEIGGSGGSAGDGDTVTVTNDGAIATKGRLGHGIVAHSVGGGGGNGAEGALGIQAWTSNAIANSIADLPSNFTFVPNFTDISMAIGGSGGAAGDGGAVSAGGKGTIATNGDHAFAIHAQSIGGGGGNGGAGSTGLWSQLTVGGRGSGGGTGGAVTVSQGGAITTTGEGGVGIFAQSVGGGGGTAGDIERAFSDSWLDLNIGVGAAMQEQPGTGGDGGDIVVVSGAITTTGVRAHGIVAQSVGGSGGMASVSGDVGSATIKGFAGGAGDGGNGGALDITVNGAISVAGAQAHGIFAQSSTGRLGSGDEAGDVTIKVNADITASGSDGRAILAQSEGDPSGTIAITVAEAATVSTATAGAETIGLFHGTGNSITNDGVIRHLGSAADDYVIRTNGFGLTVQNNGVIEGSMLSASSQQDGPPGGPIQITNASAGFIGLGTTVNLGNGGSITNEGTISAGTVGTIGRSSLAGTLIQSSDGALVVDYDFAGENDLISISGAQPELAGAVDPAPQDTPAASGSEGSFMIIATTEGVASNSLTVASTATVDYALSQQGNNVELKYAVNYAPWAGDAVARSKVAGAVRKRITGNHTSFAAHLDGLVRLRQTSQQTSRQTSSAGGADAFGFVDELALYLLQIEDVADLVEIYDRFAPEEIFAPSETALFSSLRFADDLMSCPASGEEGTTVFTREGSCSWARLAGVATRRDGESSDFDENVFSLSGGAQTEIASDTFAGVAVGYERSDLSGSGIDGDGNRFNLGAVIKREIGATTLSGSLSGGFSDFDLTRQVIVPNGVVSADSDPKTVWVAGHVQLAHVLELSEAIFFKPLFDIGVQHIWQDDYEESGAGDYGLDVSDFDQTVVTLNPMLELGTTFTVRGLATEAVLGAGALALLGNTDPSTTVRFVGAGGDGRGYGISGETQDLFGSVNAAVKARVSERVTVGIDVRALISSDQQTYNGSLKLAISF